MTHCQWRLKEFPRRINKVRGWITASHQQAEGLNRMLTGPTWNREHRDKLNQELQDTLERIPQVEIFYRNKRDYMAHCRENFR
jgi:uncharacterized C2H2 Zn-finger protein